MKYFLCLAFSGLFTTTFLHSQVTIGTNNPPHSSAVLDLQSQNKGFLLSRLTTVQRNAIQAPAVGLQIFNTDTKCIQVYMPAAGWKNVSCDCINFPNAAFTQPQTITPNTPATFSASSPGLLYNWTFPSGNPATSTSQSQQVTWSQPGTYPVVLHVADAFGCTDADTHQVVVQSCIPGQDNPAFTFSPNTISVGNNITFSPVTTTGVTYSWTFQGGNPATSTAQNPVVSWANTGNYTITLTITNIQNGCTNSSSQTVTVNNCQGGTVTFSYTGAMQTWTVPNCVSQINVQVRGAQGGTRNGGAGGNGALVSGTMNVVGGSTIYIFVGGAGGNTGAPGWNGGGTGDLNGYTEAGGGGGASDIRVGGQNLNNRVVVAAGGGGSGWNYAGGQSGIATGGNGAGPYPGIGGTQGGGGAAGQDLCMTAVSTPGVLGIGGNGASGGCGSGGGGGGGGGYYGGGGGGTTNPDLGSGGGGGSSFTGALTNLSTSAGVQTGNGQIVIQY